MSLRLLLAWVLMAVLAVACSQEKNDESSVNYLENRIQNPEVGDIYVIKFVEFETGASRYFFYKVFDVKPDAVSLYAARQAVDQPNADASAPGFFSDKTLVYTRAEALELLNKQPGDRQQTQLVYIRPAK